MWLLNTGPASLSVPVARGETRIVASGDRVDVREGAQAVMRRFPAMKPCGSPPTVGFPVGREDLAAVALERKARAGKKPGKGKSAGAPAGKTAAKRAKAKIEAKKAEVDGGVETGVSDGPKSDE